MAHPAEGASTATFHHDAPSGEPSANGAQDQGASDWSWGTSGWGWGDSWARQGWYRPYGYRNHWSWGSQAEWNRNSFESFRDLHGDGDDDQGQGSRSDDQLSHGSAGNEGEAWTGNRRASWTSSGAWTGEAATRASTTPSDGGTGQETSAFKGSFSEKMAVPSFDASSAGENLGVSARSYLRQVEAWTKVTRTPKNQQALLLYQHLAGRAWVESEELNVEELAGEGGLKVFKAWIAERYQEVEVSKIAESLTAFFRRLKRQPGQTIREFNSAFDRSHSRLLEIDCRLPEVARAWAYLSALGLNSSEELALLASVGNDYNTVKLQRAAVLHEKSLRPPWQPRKNFSVEGKGLGKGVKATYLTGIDEVDEGIDGNQDEDDDPIPEHEAILLHEAYVAQETAKSKYREVAKARGIDPRIMKDHRRAPEDEKGSVEDRLASAKARSYCAGCGRKGHWHKDASCPLNAHKQTGDQQAHVTSAVCEASVGSVVQVAYEVGDLGGAKLLAITDTACSKSVMGQRWLEDYTRLARASGIEVQFINAQDDFRFGASRLFRASYTASIAMEISGRCFVIRASVVDGEVPLLLSRKALSKLGMIYDIENHTATFKHLGVDHFKLLTTDNGHPAIQVSPKAFGNRKLPSPQEWADDEVRLFLSQSQYMAHTIHMTSDGASVESNSGVDDRGDSFPAGGPLGRMMRKLFYPKKINAVLNDMLCATPLNTDLFATWWGRTPISKDFWIETASAFIRVHVVPRKGFFDPSQWNTTQTTVKQDLLRSIGEIRSTSAVSCSSHHALQQVHDTWKDNLHAQHPVLWVGRTIFSRASDSGPCDPSPPSTWSDSSKHGIVVQPRGERVAHEQNPTPLEGHVHGNHGTPLVERRRDQAACPGEEEGYGGDIGHPQGFGVNEQIPAPGAVQEPRHRAPGEGNQWQLDLAHQGQLYPEQRGCRGDVRPSQRETLQGGPGELPPVGDSGSEGARTRRSESGLGELECVRSSLSPADGRVGLQSRGIGSGPTSTGHGVVDELGRGLLERADTHDEGDEREGRAVERSQGTDADHAEERSQGVSDKALLGSPQHRNSSDATGRAARSEIGSGGAHGETGSSQGQVRLVSSGDGHNEYESEAESLEGMQVSPGDIVLNAGPHRTSQDDHFFDCQENAVAEGQSSDEWSVECRARELLTKRDFSFGACERIVECVCKSAQATRKRKINEGTCSVALGAYSHGNHYGVISRTYQYWNVAKYLNAFMRFHGAKGQWSSLQLGYNCHVGPHIDAHNLSESVNWAISFGDFSKGRLWLECDPATKANDTVEIHEATLSDGTRAQGRLCDTRHCMTSFSPKTRHAVEDWSGIRCSIVAYTTRGIGVISRPERDVLRSCAFPLGRHEGSESWEKEHRIRPKKSIRKNLWKGARRASALLTLGFAAASSYVTENVPLGKPVEQVSLLEIGGSDLTYEILEAGFRTIEPLSWDDYLNSDRALNVHDTITSLKPQVLWFQGNGDDENPRVSNQIMNTADIQLSLEGSFVYQAKANDPFWECPGLKELLRDQPHFFQELNGDQILRVGLQHEAPLGDHADDVCDKHGVHVASHVEGVVPEHHGASAIHFDKSVPKHVQAALARLHQNLGHPKVEDMTRHLRYAGADEAVIKACKKMRCDVCARNQKTGCARPAVMPSLLDMNQLVSIDVFSVLDSQRVRHEFLSIIDHATTFHLVAELEGHSGDDFCRQFTQVWGNVFGAPGTISADLESGLQVGVAKYAEFHGSRLRSSAGQAHWQQGVIERHGLWYLGDPSEGDRR